MLHTTESQNLEQGMRLPLVSIALATFNGEQFIAEQVESLIAQTYPNLEIIISDDGSTDRTFSILKSYAERYSHIFIYSNNGEKGLRKNFEHALKKCNAPYIALCDQDDVWLPGKIALLVEQIGEASLIYHDSLLVNAAGHSLNRRVVKKEYTGKDPKVFLLKNVVSGHACLFKKELLEAALPFPGVMYPDWWLAAIAADQDGVRYCPEVLVHYRQHSNNTSDFMGSRRDKADAYESHMQDILRFQSFTRLKRSNSFFHEWYLLNENKSSKWFCFRLFYLSLRNRGTLFLLFNKSRRSVFFRCLGFLWGFSLKGIIDKKYHFNASQPVSRAASSEALLKSA